MELDISVELEGADKLVRKLLPDVYEKAHRSTLKDVGDNFRTNSVEAVTEEYAIGKRYLGRKIKTRMSGRGSESSFYMDVQSRTINLAKFEARQTLKGVTVKVKKNSGGKLIKGAFIRRDSNGVRRVFMRKTKERLPLSAKNSLSAPQMFRDKLVEKQLQRAKKYWVQRFDHNLEHFLRKA